MPSVVIVTPHSLGALRDPRTMRFAHSFENADWDVTIISKAGGGLRRSEDIEAARALSARTRRAIVPVRNCSAAVRAVWRTLIRNPSAVLLVREFRWALPILAVARSVGSLTVLDASEPFEYLPHARPNAQVGRLHQLEAVGRRWYEWTSMRAADIVVTVCPENQRRLISKFSVRRVLVVPNAPTVEEVREITPAPPGLEHDTPRVVYLGVLSPFRGIERAVEAVRRLNASGWRIGLDLYGPLGRGVSEGWLQSVTAGSAYVRYRGVADPKHRFREIRTALCGLALHESNPLTEHTEPNKPYEFLAAGVPIVTSDIGPLRRLASQYKGIIPTPHEATQVAERVRALLAEGLVWEPRFRQALRSQLISTQPWETSFRGLLSTIDRVRQQKRGAEA